tara:strand:+ start:1280 stop:1579 length:300 start_codon:yes stop_codon:yes gene_type:complete
MGLSFEDARRIVMKAFSNLQGEMDSKISEPLEDSSDILEILDSMDVVNLIMETESLIEQTLGHYVPLANEYSFDLAESPLLELKSWINHVFEMSNKDNE